MRPLGVSLVALLNWLRAGLCAFGGLVLILVGHLSGRLAAMIGSGPLLERVLSAVGKTLGFAALLVAVVWLADWSRLVDPENLGPLADVGSHRAMAVFRSVRAFASAVSDAHPPHYH